MEDFQRDFIEFAIACEVLCFGQFMLKSGRPSPYFFNSGLFNTGLRLARLGDFYASTIVHASLQPNLLFGPAYKGIPLVCSTAIALAQKTKSAVPYCFNRKEAKNHGEGGSLVGAPLTGDVLIVDDVVTAGTSVSESMRIIADAGARCVGVVVALDRQEAGPQGRSAIQEIVDRYGIPVYSIINLELILGYLRSHGRDPQANAMEEHRRKYCLLKNSS
jgi:orotate phosphoribosyltransferase